MKNGKTNGSGHDPRDGQDKVVRFPSQKERAQQRRRTEKQAKKAGGAEPFFNFGRVPLFTRIFLGVILLVNLPFFLFLDSGAQLALIHQFGFAPLAFSGPLTGAEEWRWTAVLTPFTHIALHGGWFHLFMNAAMGTALCLSFERMHGARAAARFFVVCCLAGAALYMALGPFSSAPVVGASAGISGLFGAMILEIVRQVQNQPRYYSSAAIVSGQHAMRQKAAAYFRQRGPWPVVILWGVLMTVFGLLLDDNIAWTAHLGGYIAGVLLARR